MRRSRHWSTQATPRSSPAESFDALVVERADSFGHGGTVIERFEFQLRRLHFIQRVLSLAPPVRDQPGVRERCVTCEPRLYFLGVPSTLMGVTVLGYDDQLVEIEAVAAVTD